MNNVDAAVSASDWSKGISLSILASIIGGASKLAIRKSWLMEEEDEEEQRRRNLPDDDSLLRPVMDADADADTDQEDPLLHQRQRQHPSRHEDDEEEQGSTTHQYNTNGEAIVVVVVVVPKEQLRKVEVDVDVEDADAEERQNSHRHHEERTPSLRSRRTTSRSSTSDDDEDVSVSDDRDSDNDDDGEDCRGSSKLLLARCLRGSGMIGMTLLNPLACVLAMNYASPSILAPFSGLTLVWIVLLSNPVIGEQPTAAQIMAACLIMFGEVVVAVFGDHTNDEGVTVEDVRDSYFRTPFLLFFAALSLWMLLMFHWMHSRSVSPTLRRFAWGVSSGSITGLQNFLKDSSTLLKAERGPGQGLPWYLPLFAILAIVSAFSGLLLLTACMKRYDATYSSAMFVGSFVVSASIMSACHYSTFQHLETLWNQILYPAGLLILMGGVLLLVKAKKESPENDSDDGTDDITGTSTPEERSESETKTRRRDMQLLFLKRAQSM